MIGLHVLPRIMSDDTIEKEFIPVLWMHNQSQNIAS